MKIPPSFGSRLRFAPFIPHAFSVVFRWDRVQDGFDKGWRRQGCARSNRNVVDATNYVLLELGQPLHAFDAAKIRGGIVVRFANPGEELLALDGKVYELGPNDLVIADHERVLVIAGAMGGEGSGVAATTTDLLLEAADSIQVLFAEPVAG